MALVKEYFEITKKYKIEYGHKTILLMQVGAFFEVYGLLENKDESQIYEFAQICDLNIGDKKTVGSEQVVMAGFSLYMIDKYIKKLQDAGYTIIIYEQDETKTTRHLTEIYSPGTYFSLETSNNSKLTNNITCIWINISTNHKNKNKIVHVGLANIDIYTGKSSIFEFSEIYVNNPTTFDE